jgi:hypothetical protein
MQNHHQHDDSNLYVFFFGAIFNLFANTHATELTDYALKATIGGIIWLLFKLLSDFLSNLSKNKKTNAEN